MLESAPPKTPSASTCPVLVPQGAQSGKPGLPLSRPFTLVGSRNRAHLHLLSSSVSRNHACIIATDTGLYLRDLASRTGVVINGRRVKEVDLNDGDLIQLGNFTFKFSDPAGRVRFALGARTIAAMLEIGNTTLTPVEGRSLLIGRRPICDIALPEASVSNTHAMIFEINGQRFIRDLGSRTGTLVNGKPIHHQRLEFGDQIKTGDTEFRYVSAEAPHEPEPLPMEVEQRPVDLHFVDATANAATEAGAEPLAPGGSEVSAPMPELETGPEPELEAPPEPELEAAPEPAFEAAPEPEFEAAPEPEFETAPEPEFEPIPLDLDDSTAAAEEAPVEAASTSASAAMTIEQVLTAPTDVLDRHDDAAIEPAAQQPLGPSAGEPEAPARENEPGPIEPTEPDAATFEEVPSSEVQVPVSTATISADIPQAPAAGSTAPERIEDIDLSGVNFGTSGPATEEAAPEAVEPTEPAPVAPLLDLGSSSGRLAGPPVIADTIAGAPAWEPATPEAPAAEPTPDVAAPPADLALTAPVDLAEIVEQTEPTPESALDLETAFELPSSGHLASAAPDTAADGALSDTAFGRAVQEFSGDDTGPLVEAPARTGTDEPPTKYEVPKAQEPPIIQDLAPDWLDGPLNPAPAETAAAGADQDLQSEDVLVPPSEWQAEADREVVELEPPGLHPDSVLTAPLPIEQELELNSTLAPEAMPSGSSSFAETDLGPVLDLTSRDRGTTALGSVPARMGPDSFDAVEPAPVSDDDEPLLELPPYLGDSPFDDDELAPVGPSPAQEETSAQLEPSALQPEPASPAPKPALDPYFGMSRDLGIFMGGLPLPLARVAPEEPRIRPPGIGRPALRRASAEAPGRAAPQSTPEPLTFDEPSPDGSKFGPEAPGNEDPLDLFDETADRLDALPDVGPIEDVASALAESGPLTSSPRPASRTSAPGPRAPEPASARKPFVSPFADIPAVPPGKPLRPLMVSAPGNGPGRPAPARQAQVPRFTGNRPPNQGKISAFDGLALPPVREADVFSQAALGAESQAVFGGASGEVPPIPPMARKPAPASAPSTKTATHVETLSPPSPQQADAPVTHARSADATKAEAPKEAAPRETASKPAAAPAQAPQSGQMPRPARAPSPAPAQAPRPASPPQRPAPLAMKPPPPARSQAPARGRGQGQDEPEKLAKSPRERRKDPILPNRQGAARPKSPRAANVNPAPHDPPAPPAAPAPKRKPWWKSVGFLLPFMFVTMGAAVASVLFLVPRFSTVQGTLIIKNLEKLPGMERKDLVSRLRASIRTVDANVVLESLRTRNVPPGFAADPAAYDELSRPEYATFDESRGALVLTRRSEDAEQDRKRLAAVLAAVYAQNQKMTDVAASDQQELDQAKVRLLDLQRQRKAQAAAVSKLSSDIVTLAGSAAEDLINDPRSAIESLQRQQQQLDAAMQGSSTALEHRKQEAAASFASALGDVGRQLKALAGADAARVTDYVSGAQRALADLHELDQQVSAQRKADDQTINQLRQQLADRRDAHLRQIWANDGTLNDLVQQHEDQVRRYGAASGSGSTDEASRIKGVVDELEARIDARRKSLAIGDEYTDELPPRIAQTLARIEQDRQRDQRQLEQKTSALAGLALPEGLPADQQAGISELGRRLAALRNAQDHYGAVLLVSAHDAEAQARKLQSTVADQQGRVDARRHELANASGQEISGEQQTDRSARLAVAPRDLEAAQAADNDAALAVARNRELLGAVRELADARGSVVELDEKLHQARDDAERHQRTSARATSLLPPDANSIVIAQEQDQRVNYLAGALLAIAALFAGPLWLSIAQPHGEPVPPMGTVMVQGHEIPGREAQEYDGAPRSFADDEHPAIA